MKDVSDTSLRRELRKLIFDHPTLSFFDLRELALGLFPDAENAKPLDSEIDPVHSRSVNAVRQSVDAARSTKAAVSQSNDAKLVELIESQKQLVTSIQLLVEQQKGMQSEMQRMSGALECLKGPRASKPSNDKYQTQCSFCHKYGHRVENCFKRQILAVKPNGTVAPRDNSDTLKVSENEQPPLQRAL